MDRPVRTRLGDGALVEMTPAEIREDVLAGSELGARRSKAPPLTDAEVDHLVDIFASEAKFSAVDMGDEVCLSFDGSGNLDSGTRVDELYSYQSHRGADMLELFAIDYSYKAVKTMLSYEAQEMKTAQLNLIAPLQYGAMPDLGRYSMPDGPVPNWSELMPLGRIAEARDAQVEAIDHAVSDMVYVAEGMWEAGADGMDFDTAGGRRRRRLPRDPDGDRDDQGSLPRHRHRAGHGGRVRARHARRAHVQGPPARRDVAQGAARGGPGGRRHHVRAGRQRQHDASRWPGTSPARAPSSSRAWTSPRSPCTPTWAWASAACR